MKIDSAILLGGELEGLVLPAKTSIDMPSAGQLAVDGIKILEYSSVSGIPGWQEVTDLTPDQDLFAFTSQTFTNAGYSGAYGPSLEAFKSVYGSQPWINTPAWFNAMGGIQKFTIPKTGIYSLDVTGGCFASSSIVTPGNMKAASVALERGDVLSIVCGQHGDNLLSGSGASLVVSQKRGLLLIAGGTGGYRGSGAASASGQSSGSPGTGNGGNSNSFSPGSNTGGGGAGWLSDGKIVTGSLAGAALCYANGAIGGHGSYDAPNSRTIGGFGGGGGGSYDPNNYGMCTGGGGGYTGGASLSRTSTTLTQPGFGGTSFALDGIGGVFAAGTYLNAGQVVLTFKSAA